MMLHTANEWKQTKTCSLFGTSHTFVSSTEGIVNLWWHRYHGIINALRRHRSGALLARASRLLKWGNGGVATGHQRATGSPKSRLTLTLYWKPLFWVIPPILGDPPFPKRYNRTLKGNGTSPPGYMLRLFVVIYNQPQLTISCSGSLPCFLFFTILQRATYRGPAGLAYSKWWCVISKDLGNIGYPWIPHNGMFWDLLFSTEIGWRLSKTTNSSCSWLYSPL